MSSNIIVHWHHFLLMTFPTQKYPDDLTVTLGSGDAGGGSCAERGRKNGKDTVGTLCGQQGAVAGFLPGCPHSRHFRMTSPSPGQLCAVPGDRLRGRVTQVLWGSPRFLPWVSLSDGCCQARSLAGSLLQCPPCPLGSGSRQAGELRLGLLTAAPGRGV